jgi:hypothetical protein
MLPKDRQQGDRIGEEPEVLAPADRITLGEVNDALQPAAEIIAQSSWDKSPKTLAISMALRIFVEEHLPEIAARAQTILDAGLKAGKKGG